MNEVYKDFEDGVLTRKQMAEKYGVCPQTISNWKKKYLAAMEEKKQDDKVESFVKEAIEIADRNVKDGINNTIKYRIRAFIVANRYDNIGILKEVYDKFGRRVQIMEEEGRRRNRLKYEFSLYLALCCLFNPKLVNNNNEYFHYLVSNKENT